MDLRFGNLPRKEPPARQKWGGFSAAQEFRKNLEKFLSLVCTFVFFCDSIQGKYTE
jgi:hypothetical protein